MAMRLLEGRHVVGREYELTVEYSFLGLFKKVQKYRGNYAWKLYPQGRDADPVIIQPWLEAQLQQYKWSQEYTKSTVNEEMNRGR